MAGTGLTALNRAKNWFVYNYPYLPARETGSYFDSEQGLRVYFERFYNDLATFNILLLERAEKLKPLPLKRGTIGLKFSMFILNQQLWPEIR